MTSSEIMVAALAECRSDRSPSRRHPRQPWGDKTPATPDIFYRAHCIGKRAVGEKPLTFDEWCARALELNDHHPAIVAWLENEVAS